MLGIPTWLVGLFVVSVGAQAYFFLMQRAALNACRCTGLPEAARMLMLPGWYGLAWLFTGAKWLSILLIFVIGGWGPAVAALLVQTALMTVCPVPWGHFFPILSRHLVESVASGSEEAPTLLLALYQANEHHKDSG